MMLDRSVTSPLGSPASASDGDSNGYATPPDVASPSRLPQQRPLSPPVHLATPFHRASSPATSTPASTPRQQRQHAPPQRSAVSFSAAVGRPPTLHEHAAVTPSTVLQTLSIGRTAGVGCA